MGRRRLVVLVSALLMIALGAGVVGALVAATQGELGRDWIRRVVQARFSSSLRGSVRLGTISGSFITDLQVDSIEVRDAADSLFFVAGPISLTFDPRDILDGRLFIRSVDIERPRMALRKSRDGTWAHQRLFAPTAGGAVSARGRGTLGNLLVLEQVRVRDGELSVTLPRSKPDSLGRTTQVYEWKHLAAEAPRVRIAYPDSAGIVVDLARLDVVESTPPFTFSDVRGRLRRLGDSVWLDIPHFALPGSVGHAEGKVWWGAKLAAQYRIRVEGDSVALADVAWISPSLPTTGGGRMRVDIRNARGVPEALEYAITRLDVRSHASRLRGQMTWVVGGPATILRDVDMEAAPLDFKLIERFTQEPLPYPFAGRITGRLRASGGPLDRFAIDDVTMRFVDDNVAGAEARANGKGELDIFDPANTIFRGFDLTLAHFDLRTMQALNPDFPRLNGTVSGVARLDSSWMDLRFSETDITHRDGDGPPTRLRGRGRLTTGDVMSYELDATALPLAFSTLVRSFPAIPLRGDWTGPLRVRGTTANMLVETDLEGEAGRFDATLTLDSEAPRYRVAGISKLTAIDPRIALGDRRAPSGELNARLAIDVDGDSLANLQGTANLAIDRSTLDGVRIFAGDARVRFVDGRARLDTLQVETTALAVSASGALGLHAARADSVLFQVRIDSLGGLRRWLATAPGDSLDGQVALTGTATGWLRDFSLVAELEGSRLHSTVAEVGRLSGSIDLTRLPGKPTGTLTIAGDTMRSAGLSIARAFGRATLDGEGRTGVGLQMTAASGADARISALVDRRGDTLGVRVDTATLATALQRWTLAGPASFTNGPGGFAVDSFVLLGSQQASLRFGGSMPVSDSLALVVRARGLPVEDVAELLQVAGTQRGRIDADVDVGGTRAAPRIEARATLHGGILGGIRLDTLIANASAVADAVTFNAALGRPAAPVLRAEGRLPLRLALDGAGPSMVEDGPVRATVRGDSVSLQIFEALTRRTTGDPGSFALTLDVGGTWRRPRLDGGLVVKDGNLLFEPLGNTRWRSVAADIGFAGDSIAIRRFSAATSVTGRNGRASATGWVTVTDRTDPHFDVTVRANAFNLYNVPNVADIDVSDSVNISGSLRNAALRGSLTADRAIISIPELATKDVIALEEFDGFGIRDSTRLLLEGYRPRQPSVFEQNLSVRNVPIRMGRDVWLRSEEANINLGGAVSITRGQITRGAGAGQSQLALTGTLQTVRGTYRLNLGPVQRTFEVESGGLQFFGDPDLNAGLDINALHTVRQYSKQGSQPDVRVRVHLGGTLLQPVAELSSPDSSRVKNADLISYLVTGGPSFEIAGQGSDYYASTAARVLLSSLGSVLGRKIGSGLCDDAQFSTSGAETGAGNIRDFGGSVLSGTRFNCARQIGDKAFVRLDAGLCQVGQLVSSQGGGNPVAFANAIGVKVDYLLRPGLTLSGGVEPPTSAVLCSQDVNARGFVPTPQQFGLDLFRAWRF